jgi:hypothetical protein
MIHTLIIMIAARILENVRFKILTVVLLRIQASWDSSVVMDYLECLKLKALCSCKMPRTASQWHSVTSQVTWILISGKIVLTEMLVQREFYGENNMWSVVVGLKREWACWRLDICIWKGCRGNVKYGQPPLFGIWEDGRYEYILVSCTGGKECKKLF